MSNEIAFRPWLSGMLLAGAFAVLVGIVITASKNTQERIALVFVFMACIACIVVIMFVLTKRWSVSSVQANSFVFGMVPSFIIVAIGCLGAFFAFKLSAEIMTNIVIVLFGLGIVLILPDLVHAPWEA